MTFEKTANIAVIIISIIALCVSLWQGSVTREHNRLSLAPHIQISPRLVGGKNSGLYMENAGTGSAFIKAISLSVKGRSFDLTKNSWSDFFKYINVKPGCFKERWIRVGSAIQAGKEMALITVTEADAPLCNLEALKFLTEPEVYLNITYTSPYKEVYEYSHVVTLSQEELGDYVKLINMLKKI